MAYLDKVEELKNILNQLDGYHVDAKRIPSVIKKTLHNGSTNSKSMFLCSKPTLKIKRIKRW